MRTPQVLITVLTVVAILMPTASHASQSDIDMQIEQASALIDTSPDSALILAQTLHKKQWRDMTLSQRAQLLSVEGNSLFSSGRLPEAIARFRDGVHAAREARDTTTLISALNDLGVAYRVAQHPDSALRAYREALHLIETFGSDATDEAYLLTSMAILFTNSGRFAEAAPYARRAVSRAEESGSLETMMYAGSQGGLILYKAGNHNEGREVERRIVAMAQQKGAPRYVLKAYAAIIDMHHNDGNTDSVMTYIERGKHLLDKVPEGSVESIGFLEESYVVLAAMGRHRESLDLQLKILGMKDADTHIPSGKLWLSIARNYKALGDYNRMSEAYERSIELTDSMRAIDIDNQLSEFDTKYRTAQKELEIARLETEKSRARTFTTLWIAVSIVIVVCLAAYIATRRRKEALARTREHLRGIEHERDRLARDLHDGVCNDLLGIGLMLETSNADKAEAIDGIRKVRDEVRHISHELMPPSFKDTGIDELMRDYTRRQGAFVVYSSTGTDEIDPGTAYELYRIIQEVVSNIRSHTNATEVSIKAAFDHSHAKIAVSHSGTTRQASTQTAGIGLATIRRRAQIIKAAITHDATGTTNTTTIAV